ncbi:glycosyltransferase 87 family protein [Antribacter gilvus]|uniref:glycosyltransferase 87 family protein n=1 Tax=Antribacter gilvus TaxID=2304675 RepID=UPI000F77DDF9|nr:glycosyltransferase 87 family protein [Antribacter gilvus]
MAAPTSKTGLTSKIARALGSWPALWIGFALVHVLLIQQAWQWEPQIYGDVALYEWWARNGLDAGWWPVFDGEFVYPVGALLPITLPALWTPDAAGYKVVWTSMICMLDAVAFLALGSTAPRGRVAAWSWLAFLVALGPIFLGRLDGVIAPLILVSLLIAMRHPAVAMALATVGAWIKIAPGAVAVALLAVSRRPLRDVVLPGAAVTVVAVGWALIGGSGTRVLDVFGEQGERGLQVESVAATPFVVAHRWDPTILIEYNEQIFTYEVLTDAAARVAAALDVALAVAVVLVAALTWWAGRRRPDRLQEVLLLSAAAQLLALIVFNKVGSPQFIAWIGPPLVAGIALSQLRGLAFLRTWAPPLLVALVIGRLTFEIFPAQYGEFLGGWPHMVWIGGIRNGLIVVLFLGAVVRLVQLALAATPFARVVEEPAVEEPSRAEEPTDATP